MTSASAAKGYRFEVAVVEWLRANGWPRADRRVKHGFLDTGDIEGVDDVVLEAKSARTVRLGPWLDETERERVTDEAEFGVLVVKRTGVLDAGEAFAVVKLSTVMRMIAEIQTFRSEAKARSKSGRPRGR